MVHHAEFFGQVSPPRPFRDASHTTRMVASECDDWKPRAVQKYSAWSGSASKPSFLTVKLRCFRPEQLRQQFLENEIWPKHYNWLPSEFMYFLEGWGNPLPHVIPQYRQCTWAHLPKSSLRPLHPQVLPKTEIRKWCWLLVWGKCDIFRLWALSKLRVN